MLRIKRYAFLDRGISFRIGVIRVRKNKKKE